jgi:hypothetical protein
MSDVGTSFIKEARRRLVQHFPDQVGLPRRARTRTCVAAQRGGQPSEPRASHVRSAGTSWGGEGGSDYQRDRPGEFSERGPIRAPSCGGSEDTVAETARVLDGLSPDRLRETTDRVGDVQTMQYLVSRTSHHWATHTGQIVYITKLRQPGVLNELWEKTLKR